MANNLDVLTMQEATIGFEIVQRNMARQSMIGNIMIQKKETEDLDFVETTIDAAKILLGRYGQNMEKRLVDGEVLYGGNNVAIKLFTTHVCGRCSCGYKGEGSISITNNEIICKNCKDSEDYNNIMLKLTSE